MNTFTVVDGALYQWDTGRKLKIKWENQKDIGDDLFRISIGCICFHL